MCASNGKCVHQIIIFTVLTVRDWKELDNYSYLVVKYK